MQGRLFFFKDFMEVTWFICDYSDVGFNLNRRANFLLFSPIVIAQLWPITLILHFLLVAIILVHILIGTVLAAHGLIAIITLRVVLGGIALSLVEALKD